MKAYLLSIMAFLFISVSLFAECNTVFPGDGDIAGHRILRIFNQENSGLEIHAPKVIFHDKAGRYWIGGMDVLQMYEERDSRWTTFTTEDDDLLEGLHVERGAIYPLEVGAIGQSNDGKLWFSPGNRCARLQCFVSSFNGKNWEKISWAISSHQYHRMGQFEGQNGKVWFWLDDKLISYNDKLWSKPLSLSETIKGEPRLGLKGLMQSNGDETTYEILCGLQDSKGYIWLGIQSGLIGFDEGRKEWKNYPELAGHKIMRIYEDRKGRIWFVTSGHLVYLHDKVKKSWLYYNVSKHIPPLLQDNPLSKVEKVILPITSMFQDKYNQVFFGTYRGLLVYDEVSDKWDFFTSKAGGLPSDYVTTIKEDRIGRVWIGTGKGIMVLGP